MLNNSLRVQAVYMDFDMLMGPLTARELSCVEKGDNVCTDVHMEFELIYVHFLHMMDFGYIPMQNLILNPLTVFFHIYAPIFFKRTVSNINLQR